MTTGFNSKWKPQGRVVPGLGAPSEWKGPFYFAVLADPQLGLLENNESWAEELRLLRMAVRELNRLKPAFAVVVGDLVQQPPVASAADRDSAKSSVRLKQIGDFQEALGELDSGIPLMCAAGNHDVGNSPSSFSLERHIDAFGEDYFAWDFGGVRFIVLNSSVYWDPVGGGGGGVEALAEQQAWLERELETLQTRDGKEDKKETAKVPRAVVFSHHPFFLDSVDEEGGAAMGDLCIFGKSIPRSYFHIPKERRVPVLDKMREAGVRHVFSGAAPMTSVHLMWASVPLLISSLSLSLSLCVCVCVCLSVCLSVFFRSISFSFRVCVVCSRSRPLLSSVPLAHSLSAHSSVFTQVDNRSVNVFNSVCVCTVR